MCTLINSPTNYRIVVSNESEAILKSFGVVIHSKSDKCNQHIAFSLCYYLFRNCELHNTSDPSSGLQLSICKSKCSGLKKLGDECFDESDFAALENINYNYTKTEQEIIAWALNFNCYDPSTYAVPGVPISNTSCDDISFINRLLLSTSAGELDIHVFVNFEECRDGSARHKMQRQSRQQ